MECYDDNFVLEGFRFVTKMSKAEDKPPITKGVTRHNLLYGNGYMVNCGLACVAAAVAETVTYPLDLTKTRLQIQGELVSSSAKLYTEKGMVAVMGEIIKKEGVLRLWQGLKPAVYRHFIYTSCRMGVYERCRDWLVERDARNCEAARLQRQQQCGNNTSSSTWTTGASKLAHARTRTDDGGMGKDAAVTSGPPEESHAVWKAAIVGVISGALGQLLASPADLIKVRLQTATIRATLHAGATGSAPRLTAMHVLRECVARGGVRSLWRGCVPGVARASLVTMGDLATYDVVKWRIVHHTELGDTFVTHAAASMCSGLIGALVSTPTDVVKTRLMNQPVDRAGRPRYYRGVADCVLKTVRTEGPLALYKGFIPIWSRIGPWSMTFWLTYEEIRKLCGSKPF